MKQIISSNEYANIDHCIASFDNNSSLIRIKALQERLNLLVDQSQHEAIEVLINGRSNVKAKNGLLSELCYNYLHVDNETLGCQVIPPRVQIFYETQSPLLMNKFLHITEVAQFAPFETLAQFEFIPYGNTIFVDDDYRCPLGDGQCQTNWIHVSVLSTPLFLFL